MKKIKKISAMLIVLVLVIALIPLQSLASDLAEFAQQFKSEKLVQEKTIELESTAKLDQAGNGVAVFSLNDTLIASKELNCATYEILIQQKEYGTI